MIYIYININYIILLACEASYELAEQADGDAEGAGATVACDHRSPMNPKALDFSGH